jgi:hypothetical protein
MNVLMISMVVVLLHAVNMEVIAKEPQQKQQDAD